jgi:hypothetical protein
MSDPTYLQPPADHSVKIPHLVFGLLFLGIAGIWALVVSDVITADRLTVLGPAVLIAAGVIGLAASLASGRNRRRRNHTPVAENDDTTTTRYAVTDDDEHTEEIR